MDITGYWYNELGSTMEINPVANGQFTGSYCTAVSSGCAHGSFALVGQTDTESGGDAVGFVVCWKNASSNCQSITAWSGHTNGNDQITAFWLLTAKLSSDNLEWDATQIGQDIFTRILPGEEQIAAKLKAVRRSHP